MILIVGSNHDDIVYFENILRNKREEVILKKYHATIGSIFNQSVMLLHDVYTSYISSALATYIIDKYLVLLTFVVGRCQALTGELRVGDIVISRRIMFGDIDQTDVGPTKYCSIPGFSQIYDIQQDVLLTVEEAITNRTYAKFTECTLISSNTHYKEEQDLSKIKTDNYILGFNSNIVTDSESGGVALAGILTDTPVISVKVVGNTLGKKSTTNDYLTVLKQYANVGKAVISTIGDISKNDIIRG